MFIRKKINKSGSTSIQIINKYNGKNVILRTIGCSNEESGIERLIKKAQIEIQKIKNQSSLFPIGKDNKIDEFFSELSNTSIHTVGPEIIFGKLYDKIGFDAIKDKIFRHLVIARLSFPLSKLKTVDYLYRYFGVMIKVDKIYRFLDKLSSRYQAQVEQIAFNHTMKVLNGDLSVVFYDMTTLYFEASDEDDLRKAGFNKEGRHSNPQILLGLLVGLGGYVIGYDIYEGNTYEGNTLIPFIEKISKKFNIAKPIIIADSGLLSNKNIQKLKAMNYKFILGARIKNESNIMKEKITKTVYKDGEVKCYERCVDERLIVSYSLKRAKKDAHNRCKGMKNLEKKLSSGKLSKKHINNKGYNKYLKLKNEVLIEIDYEKYEADAKWDGLKGFITNTSLTMDEIIENYNNLWYIERAFRMSKTDLRIRPIYHRIRHRIEAHICISFAAYTIYKELERLLKLENSQISIKYAAEITQNIYSIKYELPESNKTKSILLKMNPLQQELYDIVMKYS